MLTALGLKLDVNRQPISGGFVTFTLVLTLEDHSFSTTSKFSGKLTFFTP